MQGNEMLSREVDGQTYEFSQFGAKKATKLLVRMARIAGAPMAVSLGTMRGGLGIEGLNSPDAIGKISGALFNQIDENEVVDILEQVIGGDAALCDGKKIVFDLHYQKRLGHMAKVFRAALEVQYGNFFEELSVVLPMAAPAQRPVSNQTPQM